MSARPRPDPPAARQPRAGDDLGRRHQRRGARHRPRARRADLRHRRLAAEGAHGDVLLRPPRRAPSSSADPDPDVPATSPRRATFLSDPAALTGQIRLLRPRRRQSLAALFPGRRGRPSARALLAPDRASSTPSRPACSRRWSRRPRRRMSASSSADRHRHAADLHRASPRPAGSPTASRSSRARCRSTAAARWSAASASRATASTRTT